MHGSVLGTSELGRRGDCHHSCQKVLQEVETNRHKIVWKGNTHSKPHEVILYSFKLNLLNGGPPHIPWNTRFQLLSITVTNGATYDSQISKLRVLFIFYVIDQVRFKVILPFTGF